MEHNRRLMEYSPALRKWIPRAGSDCEWPWPSLVPVPRKVKVYKEMMEKMTDHAPLNGFNHVLDIGQDRGESLIYINDVSNKITGLDVDMTMIDLSLANYRMSGRHYDPVEVYGMCCPPDKLIVDMSKPHFQDIDLVKIDAGHRTPFILEMLAELIQQNQPTIFICHDESFSNESIWDTMFTKYNYHSSVVSAEHISSPHGVFIAYLKKEQDHEKEEA